MNQTLSLEEREKDLMRYSPPTGTLTGFPFVSLTVMLALDERYLPLNFGAKFLCLPVLQVSELSRSEITTSLHVESDVVVV